MTNEVQKQERMRKRLSRLETNALVAMASNGVQSRMNFSAQERGLANAIVKERALAAFIIGQFIQRGTMQKTIETELAKQGLTPSSLNRQDVINDLIEGGWTLEQIMAAEWDRVTGQWVNR
jgi:hypothetical protein